MMYRQSGLRPSPMRPIHRQLGRESPITPSRSLLPKPQGSPKPGGGTGLRKNDGKSQHTLPSRALPKEQKDKLLKNLTPLQYKVTQEKITERPYSNTYYKHFERGIYSCVVCGEPLFLSQNKYESKSGWPAFYDIIDETKVSYKQDLSHLGANLLLLVCNPSLARIEVSCAVCGAHLGHVFDDGPKPTGKRFCVNSAALYFTPADCEKIESLKRGKEEEDSEAEKRKRRSESLDDVPNTTKTQDEPMVHVASSTNSCASGVQICFRVPSASPTLS